MSKIKKGALDQYGAERFGILSAHFATIIRSVGLKGLKQTRLFRHGI